jgi:hypothetical protein
MLYSDEKKERYISSVYMMRRNLPAKQKTRHPDVKRKMIPHYHTHAENYYYLKQMKKGTVVTVVFNDGATTEGRIQWYDKDCTFQLSQSG